MQERDVKPDISAIKKRRNRATGANSMIVQVFAVLEKNANVIKHSKMSVKAVLSGER